MKKKPTSAKTARDPNSRINKALRPSGLLKEDVMDYCKICPYPAKCERRGRCMTGNEVAQAEPVKEAAPKTVKKKKAK